MAPSLGVGNPFGELRRRRKRRLNLIRVSARKRERGNPVATIGKAKAHQLENCGIDWVPMTIRWLQRLGRDIFSAETGSTEAAQAVDGLQATAK